MERNGADIIIEALERQGVRIVAGMPGGANLPLYDALSRGGIRHVLVRHEQAAGFIAQGMARVSGEPAVCFATSGPGATNLLTALADAYMDSIPIVAITGQVPTALLGTMAFQEVDTVAMARPVVKHAEQVREVSELDTAIARAFEIARGGRPGPVLIDVPKDVQQARAPAARDRGGSSSGTGALDAPLCVATGAPLEASALDRVCTLLREAERPVLYIGGGVVHARAHAELTRFARDQDLPVASTLMALGCFDPHDPLSLGMLGMHGAPYTNLAMHEADLLLCIGARFDDRATGAASEFCPLAKTVHVDIDRRELGKLRALDVGIQADAGAFLRALAPRLPPRRRPAWRARVAALRLSHPLPACVEAQGATRVLRTLAARLRPGTLICTDVGQHQMWVAQLLAFERPRALLTSGGLGTMGFGLPAAIGAALASGAPVVCVTGDGSLPLNVQELATLAELELDVTVLVLDNQHLGLVRQQQVLFYGERLQASRFARPSDFVAIARGFGLSAESLANCDASSLERLAALLAQPGPRLIHVPIDAAEMVLPMVPPGAGNHVMIRERDASPSVQSAE